VDLNDNFMEGGREGGVKPGVNHTYKIDAVDN